MEFIRGHGVDLVDIGAFRRMLDVADGDSLIRYFTQAELRDAGDGGVRIERLAGRFATKEAVLKALGLGWGDGVSFTDVETVTLSSGHPVVELHGRVAEVALERGITNWLVSTAHTATSAISSVIAVQDSN